MGGAAFTTAPFHLHTPRMPPAVYQKVKHECHAQLRALYLYVASPIEGPGKLDHGDIDIIVFFEQAVLHSSPGSTIPHPRTGREPLSAIAAALGAEHTIYDPHHTSANVAIPWPEDNSGDSESDRRPGATSTTRRHIQVDVRIALSLQEFHWSLFRHAHGDFWQIVGSTVRPLGLTVDEEALWIRIPEVEKGDRKRAKVLLTRDPVEILRFLGYDGCLTAQEQERPLADRVVDAGSIADDDDDEAGSISSVWEQPFASAEELFHYIATGRFFWIPQRSPPSLSPSRPAHEDEEPRSNSTANDRRRLKQRPIYAAWNNIFLPSLSSFSSTCPSIPPNQLFSLLPRDLARSHVQHQAFLRWSSAEHEYRTRLRSFTLHQRLEAQKRELVPLIKDVASKVAQAQNKGENWANCLVGALKKIVLKDDRSYGLWLQRGRDESGVLDVTVVRVWMERVAGHVGEEAWRGMGLRLREKKESAAAPEGSGQADADT